MDELTFVSGTGSVRVERHGGRVAALWPAPGLPNVLWRGEGAPVPGGDRLWPAPETEIFYEDGEWRCPPELDPGSWTLRADRDAAVLNQTALGASFARRIEAAEVDAAELRWSAYRVRDEVDAAWEWSAWHLVMVPAPARVFVRDAAEPVVYYPPAPEISDGWIEVADAPPRWKVGFDERGRVLLAAVGGLDPGPLVVVTATAPDGTYVDFPPHGGRATAVQVYSSGGDGFCELEHHAPLEAPTTDALVVGAWGSRDARLALLDRLATR